MNLKYQSCISIQDWYFLSLSMHLCEILSKGVLFDMALIFVSFLLSIFKNSPHFKIAGKKVENHTKKNKNIDFLPFFC